ncbi:hypothetical protein K450DRAFT_232089 [Umbelopsis ramanniana AG]|uniref:Cdc23 domain-containing protein n=1 Tax=Umbelopsis ramanniana AG TaxID=1314678 RepID=A0AAD5EEA2_UMBRA|nr:uncharacterized protein K450DRAFT_232089 [Umbelopsis ramanniana AG]KAI8581599.1 hypothetical protein K450DRAFT_232089 [Umbelopsis ramanniana AG]
MSTVWQVSKDLQKAILDCSERCLYISMKWAAELLDGIDYDKLEASKDSSDNNQRYEDCRLLDSSLTELENNKYLYARALFEVRQFDNAAFVLAQFTAPKLRFLRLYAKYLAGEKRKEEQSQDIMGPMDDSSADNTELTAIFDELDPLYENRELDAFCLYLYGVVLRKRKANQKATEVLLESVKEYPYFWSAWMELATMVDTRKMFQDLQAVLDQTFPKHIMKDLFLAHMALQLHQPADLFRSLMEPISASFPRSTYIKSQWATLRYDLLEYNEAEELFDELRNMNPYRLDDMDIFSNLLFVKDSKEKLSVLAHQSERIDKYRPETCCIIANYYSVKSEIAKSIEYFKKALKLNRNYHLAWTLLGHDYMEMKNSNAAIECYRRAINLNHKDFRAWYGLGQTYEILKLPYYAIYYYEKSAELRPHDPRMWVALGNCFESLDRDNQARDCYKRASLCENADKETAWLRLARVFQKTGNLDAAATYYKQVLELDEQDRHLNESEEIGDALLFLAKYEMNRFRYREASDYAKIAADFPYPYNEEAKALLEELRARGRASNG